MNRNPKTNHQPSSAMAEERPLSQRWGEVECCLYRAKTIAKLLDELACAHAYDPGHEKPLFLNPDIHDLGHFGALIGSELERL